MAKKLWKLNVLNHCMDLHQIIFSFLYFPQMLAMAVLTILILAPVGSVLISLMGPLLLRHSIEPPRLTVSEVVEEEPTSVDRQELTWDGQLDFDTELTKMKVEFPVEITTERETVT